MQTVREIMDFHIKPMIKSDAYNDYEQAIEKLEADRERYVKEAVYGFHEYIIGKNIIQAETDQAFNYARLHRALDAYIAQLTTKENQDE